MARVRQIDRVRGVDRIADATLIRLETDLGPRDAVELTDRLHAEQGTGDPFADAVQATRMPMIMTDPRRPTIRVRPKMMTVVAIVAGLVSILWSQAPRFEIMQRIAVPMIGGYRRRPF